MKIRSLFRTGTGLPSAGLTVAAIIAAHPADALAQTRSLSWTEATQVEVPGALGTLLGVTGVTAPRQSSHTLHLQGRTLIQEDGQSAVVMDLENGRWLAIDHESQSYLTMTFAEMGQLSQDAVNAAYASAASGSDAGGGDDDAAREELERTLEEAEATLDLRVSSDATGQRQSFGSGITGNQHFITTEFEATAVPEGVDEPEGGSMVFLAELWQTTDVPSSQALYEAWAQEVASDAGVRSMTEQMAGSGEEANENLAAGLATWDPQIGAGLLRMAEAIEALEGTTIRSVTTVAMVPLGVNLNRDELVAWEPASMGDQLRNEATGAARQAAADAARGAVRGISRGLFGRGGDDTPDQPAPAAADAPAVHPLFRITTSREDVSFRESGDDVLGSLEARIGAYEVQTYDDLVAQMQQ